MNRINAKTLGLIGLTLAVLVFPSSSAVAGFDHTHPTWTNLLGRFSEAGRVDYADFKAEHSSLRAYLKVLSEVPREAFDSWTQDEQLAFLINVYNAATIDLILDHYPLKSIKQIGKLFRGPWSQPVVELWQERLTLNDLEHKIIRPRYQEPRIHFALVCAAKGCPPLRADAYRGDRLEAQLDEQARIFLAQASKNRIDEKKSRLWLSPIFKWYRGDFLKESESLEDYVRDYWPTPPGGSKYRVSFTDYDWSLNGKLS